MFITYIYIIKDKICLSVLLLINLYYSFINTFFILSKIRVCILFFLLLSVYDRVKQVVRFLKSLRV